MTNVVNLNVWKKTLETDSHGNFSRNLTNAIISLRQAPEFKDRFGYDQFAQKPMVLGDLPWNSRAEPRTLEEEDSIKLQEWLQLEGLHIGARKTTIIDALIAVSFENRYHPVRDYLNSLEWDGDKRIDTWLVDYLGAEDSAYVRAVGRKFLIGAVTRIMRPGCKMDYMLVLEGKQGIFKSTALKKLADPWVLEGLVDMKGKAGREQLQGHWIVEESELDAMRRNEKEAIKQFISQTVDTYRPPYGRLVKDFPRQCVLVGTTNSEQYLRDETGNRRFWPVRCSIIKLKAIERDRDQLWSEALVAYKASEKPYLEDAETQRQAREQQEERYEEHPWESAISNWLSTRQNSEVTQLEIMEGCLGLSATQQHRGAGGQVTSILRRLGWKRKKKRQWHTDSEGNRRNTYVWVHANQKEFDYATQSKGA